MLMERVLWLFVAIILYYHGIEGTEGADVGK